MENIMIEQQPQHNYLNSFQHSHKSSGLSHSHSFNSLSTACKMKRSLSHKRKMARKLPLIKKELETETTERLIQTIYECDLSYLKQSLEKGTNANTKYNNWSLLHYACSTIDQTHCGTDQHLEMIRLLLDFGAQINSQDEDRWTPLHLACQLGLTRVISYLIRKGADKDACTIENLRPIDLVEPDNYIAVSFLISNDRL